MVDPNDPFAGLGGDTGDRTQVVKPRPGGARAPLPPGAPSQATVVPNHAPSPAAAAEPVAFGAGGMNPLERAAAPLLALVLGGVVHRAAAPLAGADPPHRPVARHPCHHVAHRRRLVEYCVQSLAGARQPAHDRSYGDTGYLSSLLV